MADDYQPQVPATDPNQQEAEVLDEYGKAKKKIMYDKRHYDGCRSIDEE